MLTGLANQLALDSGKEVEVAPVAEARRDVFGREEVAHWMDVDELELVRKMRMQGPGYSIRI